MASRPLAYVMATKFPANSESERWPFPSSAGMRAVRKSVAILGTT
jgi:hypothetical protein